MPKFCFSLLLLTGFVTFFSNCSNNKPAPQHTFGDIDKTAIATDTSMQADMERSYEYQATLVESDSVVYDFLAYDKPVYGSKTDWESKYHIIRRTGSTQDTIAKGKREKGGRVKNIWLCDIDHDGQPEIMFYESPGHDTNLVSFFDFFAFETNGRKAAHRIPVDFTQDPGHYLGADSFFVYQNRLVRKYPFHISQNNFQIEGYVWQNYKLNKGRLVLDNQKRGI